MKRPLALVLIVLISIIFNSCKKDRDLDKTDVKVKTKSLSVSGDMEEKYRDLLVSDPDIKYQSGNEIFTKAYKKLNLRYYNNYTRNFDKYYFMYGREPRYYIVNKDNRLDFIITSNHGLDEFARNIKSYYEAAEYFKGNGKTVFSAPIVSESSDMGVGLNRIIGETNDRGNTEDLTFGTNGDARGVNPDMISKTDDELFQDMTKLITKTSAVNLEAVALSFVENFKTNRSNSSTFSNQVLNKKVMDHRNFRLFLDKFAGKLQAELIVNEGKIDKVSKINMSAYRPVFNDGLADTFGGLRILINDTEKTEVRLVSYEILPDGQHFLAHIQTTIYDHFGLDKNDVLSYQGYDKGFAAWWTLQHQRSKVPFITKVILNNNIKGQFR